MQLFDLTNTTSSATFSLQSINERDVLHVTLAIRHQLTNLTTPNANHYYPDDEDL